MSSHKAAAVSPTRVKRAAGRAAKSVPRKPTVAKRAPTSAPAGDLNADAAKLAAALEAALSQGQPDRVGPEALQRLIAAVCRVYRAQIDAGASYLPLPQRTAVAPTDVMVTCGALLKAADLQVFELGMWQSFTGR